MNNGSRPRLSVIIPTLNAAALIDNCLASIRAQAYPQDRIEILLADAASTDGTREIALRHGAQVLEDPGTNMEEGKRLALAHATGDYIVFVDADNELTHPDYLALAVEGLAAHPQALGVESYYLPSAKMSAFCRYLTARLHISDVMSWLLSRNPILVGCSGEIERWTLPGQSCSYPLGANGFVFRRRDLEAVRSADHFQDTHVPLRLMQRGQREWLRVRGRGVHHYYVQTLGGYVKKRRRAIVHFFRVRDQTPVSWTTEKPPVPLWLAALYCVTFLGPLWHALRGCARDRDAAWLWHIPASLGSLLGTAWGWWTYRTHRHDPKLVAHLQVAQSLKQPAAPPPHSPTPSLPHSPTTHAQAAPKPHSSPATPRPRVVCFVNGIFAEGIGGGDTYFAYMAQAALDAGYPLHFFGGHALKRYLEQRKFPPHLTLTDAGQARLGNVSQLRGQFRLLFDFARRLRGALRQLDVVQPGDQAYAMSDYWFDTIPLIRCRARRKVLYLGMIAPTLGQVLFRTRADVTASRLASLYYWFSQQLSLRWFRRCPGGQVTYSHPEMKDYLLRFGYRPEDLHYVPNGSDVAAADRVPDQPRQFDVAWTGRVHPQKGIDDLLALLPWLKERLPDFRAVIIGKSREALEPIVRNLGLQDHVTFSGLVSEEEKFRLLKASRVFVMPSRYESWGIVVGEALAAGIPVVAYELGCYRPVFGEYVRYVAPFDRAAWFAAVEREIREMRAGRNYLAHLDLPAFKQSLDWSTAQRAFVQVLEG